MPTYQYACTECGERLEAVQSFSDPALTECPACQGKLRKVFNSVGVVFKGSGFYRNDSRKGESKPAAASSSSGDGKSSSGESKSSSESSTKADSGAAKPAAASTSSASSTSSTTS